MKLEGLGYLGIKASDLDAWEAFGTEVLGMTCNRVDDALSFRMDERSWRIRVSPSDTDEVDYLGWELASQPEWEAAIGELEAAGTAVKVADADAAADRVVRGLATLEDPAGHTLEIFYGAGIANHFVSPLGVHFVTEGLGLGHAVVLVPADKFDEALEFYTGLMGFRVTEHANVGGVEACLMHCTPRHHSLAILGAGDMTGLQHFMVEVDQMDDVGRCWDRCRRAATPISLTLGKHADDHMFGFYMKSPSGFDVEYAWGGRLLDDKWSVATLTGDFEETWGHWPPDPDWPRPADGPQKFGEFDPAKLMEGTGT